MDHEKMAFKKSAINNEIKLVSKPVVPFFLLFFQLSIFPFPVSS